MFSACANPDCKKKFNYKKAASFDFTKSILLVTGLPTLIVCSTSGCAGNVRRGIRSHMKRRAA